MNDEKSKEWLDLLRKYEAKLQQEMKDGKQLSGRNNQLSAKEILNLIATMRALSLSPANIRVVMSTLNSKKPVDEILKSLQAVVTKKEAKASKEEEYNPKTSILNLFSSSLTNDEADTKQAKNIKR